eukprot:ctg_2384.g510
MRESVVSPAASAYAAPSTSANCNGWRGTESACRQCRARSTTPTPDTAGAGGGRHRSHRPPHRAQAVAGWVSGARAGAQPDLGDGGETRYWMRVRQGRLARQGFATGRGVRGGQGDLCGGGGGRDVAGGCARPDPGVPGRALCGVWSSRLGQSDPVSLSERCASDGVERGHRRGGFAGAAVGSSDSRGGSGHGGGGFTPADDEKTGAGSAARQLCPQRARQCCLPRSPARCEHCVRGGPDGVVRRQTAQLCRFLGRHPALPQRRPGIHVRGAHPEWHCPRGAVCRAVPHRARTQVDHGATGVFRFPGAELPRPQRAAAGCARRRLAGSVVRHPVGGDVRGAAQSRPATTIADGECQGAAATARRILPGDGLCESVPHTGRTGVCAGVLHARGRTAVPGGRQTRHRAGAESKRPFVLHRAAGAAHRGAGRYPQHPF